MKGDFSRLMFDALQHYAGVLHQQGRVWLDSDWNEDVFERLKLLQSETRDIVGYCGFPEPGTAFQILPNTSAGAQPDDFLIGGGPGPAGHGYVNGILCEQDDLQDSYLNQRDYPGPQRIAMPTDGSDLNAVVYLEVWRRLITYLEDGRIREIALNGPDTTTRLKTIAQVKVAIVPNSVNDLNCPNAGNLLPGDGNGTLTTLAPVDALPPDLCRLPDPANFTGRENRLYRVEIHFGGDVLGTGGSTFALKMAQDAPAGAASLRLSRALTAAEAAVAARAQAIAIADDIGQSESVTVANVAGDTITLARGLLRSYTTAANATVTGGVARFKWSRDNASFAVAVDQVSLDRQTLTLASLGRDQATQLRQGDLVEICDDTSELSPAAHGHLTFLTGDPDPDQLTVSLADPLPAGLGVPTGPTSLSSPPGSPPSSPPVAAIGNGHLLLRRWDGQGTAQSAYSDTATPAMNLGDGVHIRFGGSDLRSGDYWQFAARSTDGSIELLDQAPPTGIARVRCPLAMVRWTSAVSSPPPFSPPNLNYTMQVLHDCRTIFPPLAQPGVHVTGIFALGARNTSSPLVNDSVVLVQRLLGGIDVTCDNDIKPATISRAVCYVTVQIPSGIAGGPASPIAAPNAYQELILAADATVAGNVIQWRLRDPLSLARLPFAGVPQDPGILARLVLKGNFVWAADNSNIFLDGDVFGFKNPAGPTTSINLPSGDRRRGGTLESWFWLSRTRLQGKPLTFSTFSNSVIVRAEGLKELVADIILTGIEGTPTDIGLQVPQVNINIILNTQITNGPSGPSDIVLLIDEPAVLNTTAFNTPNTGDTIISQTGDGVDFHNGEGPNIFRGVITAANSVTFFGVPIDPPGPAEGSFVPKRTLRVTNIRVDAAAIGIAVAPTPIAAFISANGPVSMPITNPTVTVGFVSQGSKFEVRTSAGLLPPAGTPAFRFIAAQSINPGLLKDPLFKGASINFVVQFTEQFASSFRMKTQPGGFASLGAVRNDETGFDNIGTGAISVVPVGALLPPLGQATSGTRFRIVIDNIPPNVNIFVTTRNIPLPPDPQLTAPNNPPARALLVAGAPFDGSGDAPPFVPIITSNTPEADGFQIAAISINSGQASAVWESVKSDPTFSESLRFGIVIASAAVPNSPGATATVLGGLAPVGLATAPHVGPPFPQFGAPGSAPLIGFTMAPQ